MPFLIVIPTVFALFQLTTRKYVFSPLTTLSCAALALTHSPVMAAALAVSAVGDYFMCHKGNREILYVLGIAGFFLGHVVFILYASLRAVSVTAGLIVGAVLAVGFLPYLFLRVLNKVPQLLKIPVVLYTLISITGLAFAAATGDALYIVGVASLLFSDTMIAESDFVGNPATGRLIMPTYYLCHILVALSALI